MAARAAGQLEGGHWARGLSRDKVGNFLATDEEIILFRPTPGRSAHDDWHVGQMRRVGKCNPAFLRARANTGSAIPPPLLPTSVALVGRRASTRKAPPNLITDVRSPRFAARARLRDRLGGAIPRAPPALRLWPFASERRSGALGSGSMVEDGVRVVGSGPMVELEFGWLEVGSGPMGGTGGNAASKTTTRLSPRVQKCNLGADE